MIAQVGTSQQMVRCMSERSIFSNLVRQPDGAFGAAYGAFLLQSALQPIFCERADGRLQIAAFKGLIRANAGDMPCSPAEFFERVPEDERMAVDGLCRSLHILNAGALTHTSVALRDACAELRAPLIEVHISNVHKREEFRHHSYISAVATGVIVGLGVQGYVLALRYLASG